MLAAGFAAISCTQEERGYLGTVRRCTSRRILTSEHEFRRYGRSLTRNQRTQKQRDKVPQSSQLSLPRCCFNRRSGVSQCFRFQSTIPSGNLGNIGQQVYPSNGRSKFVQITQQLTTSSVQARGKGDLSTRVCWKIVALRPLDVPRESMQSE